MANEGLSPTQQRLLFLLAALAAGVAIGVLLAPKGSRSHVTGSYNSPDNRRIQDRRRIPFNIVFGNIILGSNNAPDAVMSFGIDDTGNND